MLYFFSFIYWIDFHLSEINNLILPFIRLIKLMQALLMLQTVRTKGIFPIIAGKSLYGDKKFSREKYTHLTVF